MVGTRSRPSADLEEVKVEEKASSPGPAETIKTPAAASKARSPKSSSKKKKSKKKQQAKEELKSKNTGVGLQIDVASGGGGSSKNKKIVFDDNIDTFAEEAEKEEVVTETQKDAPKPEDDADDDDDAVEEVQGNAAREEMIETIRQEEKLAARSKKKKPKKRKERKKKGGKKNKKKKVDGEDDEDFDEEFFEQLATVKGEESIEAKAMKKPKGKHTAFVFQDEATDQLNEERKVDQNIQVVVIEDIPLQQENVLAGGGRVPTNALSEEALLYSRSALHDGSDGRRKDGDVLVAKRDRKRKNGGRPDPTWKRSKKMNLLAMGRGARRRSGGL